MSDRRYRKFQSRNGNAERRRLEFEIVKAQVQKNKKRFMARLQRNLVPFGECLLYDGTLDHNGYPRINFKHNGQHFSIHASKVFLILKCKEPIPPGYEAAHDDDCKSRACVKHLSLQHYKVNAATYHKRERPQA